METRSFHYEALRMTLVVVWWVHMCVPSLFGVSLLGSLLGPGD